MFSIAEMEINVFTTSNTGVTISMLPLHRNSRVVSQDSLLTVSAGLSTTGALVTPDLVDTSGRDEVAISSGWDVVAINNVRDLVVISSGRDMVAISNGKDMVVISSGRDMVGSNSGRDMVVSR